MKIISISSVFVSLLVTSCATPNTMLINPNSGEIRNCAASGWGWMGAPMAVSAHDSCVDSLKSIGFIPVKDIVPSELKIDSKPQGAKIFAGPEKEKLKELGATPFKLTHPKKSKLWSKECYMVKKSGYEDSSVECFEQVWKDRNVFFDLEQKVIKQ